MKSIKQMSPDLQKLVEWLEEAIRLHTLRPQFGEHTDYFVRGLELALEKAREIGGES